MRAKRPEDRRARRAQAADRRRQSGAADFTMVLVYDVSRWGRFQDADESAYYEYICKRAGIAVQYCAEQFENDGSPISTIVKGVKRAMAGEYSRELSTKVFAGQGRLIEKGYRQGGPAGFGLRRTLIDETARPRGARPRRAQEHPDRSRDPDAGPARGNCRGARASTRPSSMTGGASARSPTISTAGALSPILGAPGPAGPSTSS
jgi:DNA invertase Pin-like site-specific DNA recombinase